MDIDKTREQLVNVVRAKRMALDISKRQLAKNVGMSYYNYRRFENYENISLNGFLKILECLDMDVNLKNKI